MSRSSHHRVVSGQLHDAQTPVRGDREPFWTKITSIKNTPRNVTLFAKKKKQNGEGGLPPSPPHLLLARENRFYSFISIIMIRGGNDRGEARSEGKRVYETTSESGVRGEPSIG